MRRLHLETFERLKKVEITRDKTFEPLSIIYKDSKIILITTFFYLYVHVKCQSTCTFSVTSRLDRTWKGVRQSFIKCWMSESPVLLKRPASVVYLHSAQRCDAHFIVSRLIHLLKNTLNMQFIQTKSWIHLFYDQLIYIYFQYFNFCGVLSKMSEWYNCPKIK